MKRIVSMLVLSALFITLCPAASAADHPVMASFYVSATGSETGTGSASDPFLTVEQARDAVREINQSMTGDIVVNLAAGRYEQTEELRFYPEDSGTNGYDVIYRGVSAKSTVISGGTTVSGWTEGTDGIWTAEAPNLSLARDLYINEMPAQRAKGQKMLKGVKNYQNPHSYYRSDSGYSDGFYVKKSALGFYQNPENIVFHWSVAWKDYRILVKEIVQDPTDTDQLIVKLENPIWNSLYQSIQNGAAERLVPTYDKEFTVENALELLDEPGEFYFDKKAKKLYYYPREGENMATALAVVPQLDQLVRIDGRDPHHQTVHIVFDNLGFAHTTHSLGDCFSQANQQGEYPTTPQFGSPHTPAAVEARWANHISVRNCSIWGTELVGVSYLEGVSDSEVTGCSFLDNGSAAFMLGKAAHNYEEPHPNTTDAANLIFGAAWWASFQNVTLGADSTCFLNPNKGSEFEYRYGSDSAGVNALAWTNEPWAADQGIKSWIVCDLGDRYVLEKIRLSFQQDSAGRTITAQERSNFEVLLSNDKSFAEGNYVTAASYGETPAQEVQEIAISSWDTYRYIMLRKTVAEPFAVFSIMAFSHDREPIGRQGLCKNIRFENNFISGTGRIHTQSPAVLVHYSECVEICRNEIVNVSYSGISFGWGWYEKNNTAKNNRIANNLIDGAVQACDDGGSIYILGNQSNLSIEGNVLKNQGNMWGTLYFDSGSCGTDMSTPIRAKDTVIINGSHNVFFWNAYDETDTTDHSYADGKVIVTDTYSTTSGIDHAKKYGFAGNDYFECSNPEVFTLDNPPEKVVSIMANAGLTEEYQHLRTEKRNGAWANGPDQTRAYHRTDGVSTRAEFYKTSAKQVLDYASVGNLPWQYAPEAYFALKTAYERIMDDTNRVTNPTGGHILEEYELKDAFETANETVVHPSYREMISLSESLLQDADSYPSEAVSDFCTVVEAQKQFVPTTQEAEALAAERLEKAASAFAGKRQEADLLYAYVKGGKTEMDVANRRTVITLPIGTFPSDIEVDTLVSSGASLETNLSEADFSRPVTLTIRHGASGKTANWTLTVQQDLPKYESYLSVGVDPADWKNKNPNTAFLKRNGSLLLQPWFQPYLYQKAAETELNWRVKIDTADTAKGVELLFGCRSTDFELDVKEEKNTGYRLAIQGQSMTLSRVDCGVTTELATAADIGFCYGEDQEICLRNTDGLLQIFVNGAAVLTNKLESKDAFFGYGGIYTPNVRVMLSDAEPVFDAAESKPAFADSWQIGHEPSMANDGDPESYYLSSESEQGRQFILDLGEAYPIRAVDYLAQRGENYGSGLSVFLSDDPRFEQKTPVYFPSNTEATYQKLDLSEVYSYYTAYNEETGKWEKGHLYLGGKNYHELTDRDEETGLGGGYGADAVWIDLGSSKRMDKLEYLLYDDYRLSNGVMFYGTNENPDLALANGRIDWTPLSEPTKGGAVSVRYEGSILLSAGSSYRYIVCVNSSMDPSVSDSAKDPVGTTIQTTIREIRAYAKSSTQELVEIPNLDGTSPVRLVPMDSTTPYRYVLVEKRAGTGALAISDIKVMTAGEKQTKASPVDCISKGQPAKSVPANENVERLTAFSADEPYVQNADEGTEISVFLDLGRGMPIDYLVLSLPTADERYRRNFQLVVSNDPNLKKENDTVLVYEQGTVSSGLRLYPVSCVSQYRYVGVRALPVSGDATCLSLNQLDVYAKSDAFSKCLLPLKLEPTLLEEYRNVTSGICYDLRAGGELRDQGNRLFDNNTSTEMGFGPTAFLAYIDLGEAKQIDKIKAVGYDPTGWGRYTNVKYYVSNVLPIWGGNASWTLVGTQTGTPSSANDPSATVEYELGSRAGKYRYMIADIPAAYIYELCAYEQLTDRMTLTASVSGISHHSGNYPLLLAQYNDQGELVKTEVKTVDLPESSSYFTVKTKFDLSEAGNVKIFLLDSLTAIRPLAVSGDYKIQ